VESPFRVGSRSPATQRQWLLTRAMRKSHHQNRLRSDPPSEAVYFGAAALGCFSPISDISHARKTIHSQTKSSRVGWHCGGHQPVARQ
jgi:hypothetical protein